MTDEWFNEYMFRLVEEKKYVPADILKMFESDPVLLPAWDPMFSPENWSNLPDAENRGYGIYTSKKMLIRGLVAMCKYGILLI